MIILLTVVQKKLTNNLYKYNVYTAIGIFMNADPIVIDNMDPVFQMLMDYCSLSITVQYLH